MSILFLALQLPKSRLVLILEVLRVQETIDNNLRLSLRKYLEASRLRAESMFLAENTCVEFRIQGSYYSLNSLEIP